MGIRSIVSGVNVLAVCCCYSIGKHYDQVAKERCRSLCSLVDRIANLAWYAFGQLEDSWACFIVGNSTLWSMMLGPVVLFLSIGVITFDTVRWIIQRFGRQDDGYGRHQSQSRSQWALIHCVD